MKRILTFLVAFLFFMTPVMANNDKGYISVNSEAVKEVSPTKVNISFAIENMAKDPKEAADTNKEISNKVLEATKALVNLQNGETIKTTSYNLNPQYVYKNGQRNLIGYFAVNTLQITLKDVEKTGKVISVALANGANSVSDLQFLLDETNSECDELIIEATKGAKLRATKIAQATNSALLGIKMINSNCSVNQRNYSNFRIMNTKAQSADTIEGANVPIESGKTQIRAFVNAEFFVK